MKCLFERLSDDEKTIVRCDYEQAHGSPYCSTHKIIAAANAAKLKTQPIANVAPTTEPTKTIDDLAIQNATGAIRSIRLEIGDHVRLSGSEIAANMAAMLPALDQSRKIAIIKAAQALMETSFAISDHAKSPSLAELLAIELFFDTCLNMTKGLIGIKKVKLGIKAKDDMIQGVLEGKAREKKVAVNRSLEKVKVLDKGQRKFAHTALDMVRDIFYVSEPLDVDSSKTMKKLCDRILVSADLDDLNKDTLVALFDKPIFTHLRKFVTFK
jgi:hypothetical protein